MARELWSGDKITFTFSATLNDIYDTTSVTKLNLEIYLEDLLEKAVLPTLDLTLVSGSLSVRKGRK